MRMFVSTKYLSLMELISCFRRHPPEVETLAEPSKCSPTSLIECLTLTDHLFNPVGQQGTDGASFLSRQDTRLAKQLCVDLESDVYFHNQIPIEQHIYSCSTIIRAS